MEDRLDFRPRSFAVVGAGPVGCIVAAFLAKGGYEVTLCDVFPELLKPSLSPGILIEGAEHLQQALVIVGFEHALGLGVAQQQHVVAGFLLRRAVDLTDYERVEEVEEYTSEEASPPQPVVSEPPPAPEPPVISSLKINFS